MRWGLIVLLVLLPAILYGIALVVIALREKYLPRRCPSCGHRALRTINFIRATVMVDGKRAPDWWTFYLCMSCGKPHKRHRHAWEDVTDEERREYFPSAD